MQLIEQELTQLEKNIEDENAEIIELELAIEKGEMLIEIANKKREEEQPVEVVEEVIATTENPV